MTSNTGKIQRPTPEQSSAASRPRGPSSGVATAAKPFYLQALGNDMLPVVVSEAGYIRHHADMDVELEFYTSDRLREDDTDYNALD